MAERVLQTPIPSENNSYVRERTINSKQPKPVPKFCTIRYNNSSSELKTTRLMKIHCLNYSIWYMTILVLNNYIFFFFSNDSTEQSPPNITKITKYAVDIVEHWQLFHHIQLATLYETIYRR